MAGADRLPPGAGRPPLRRAEPHPRPAGRPGAGGAARPPRLDRVGARRDRAARPAAGRVPRQFQSGETDRRGRITRRGPGLLRKLLVECAWVMLRYNAWARSVYERLSRGKARKKQAIVALARKLLVRCWAMLRDKAEWRDDPAAPAEAAPA